MEAPDVEISAENASQYQADLAEFLTYINDSQSLFYLDNDYLLNRLLDCMSRYLVVHTFSDWNKEIVLRDWKRNKSPLSRPRLEGFYKEILV